MADTYAGSLGMALLRSNGFRATTKDGATVLQREVLSGRTLSRYTVTVTLRGAMDASLVVHAPDGRSLGERTGPEAEIADDTMGMVAMLTR